MSTISPKARAAIAASTAIVYVAMLFTLAVSGTALLGQYCEGFGCIGKGIAWFAWSVGFGAALLLGCVARRTYRGVGHQILRYALALQLGAGVALVIYWAVWRAA